MKIKRLLIILSVILLTATAGIMITSALAERGKTENAAYYSGDVLENGRLLIGLYDSEYKELNSAEVEMKLPAFEGLYQLSDGLYGVFSASLTEKADVRYVVVRYDSEMNETAAYAVCDSNVSDPTSTCGVSLMSSGSMLYLSSVSVISGTEGAYAADVTYLIDTETGAVKDTLYHIYEGEDRASLEVMLYSEDKDTLAVLNASENVLTLYYFENGTLTVCGSESILSDDNGEITAVREKAAAFVALTRMDRADAVLSEDNEISADEAEDETDEASEADESAEDVETAEADEETETIGNVEKVEPSESVDDAAEVENVQDGLTDETVEEEADKKAEADEDTVISDTAADANAVDAYAADENTSDAIISEEVSNTEEPAASADAEISNETAEADDIAVDDAEADDAEADNDTEASIGE